MANIAYVRVSTVEQNDERQREAGGHRLCFPAGRPAGPADIPPGQRKDTNRPQLQAMLEYVREGDTVYVHDFSRLARSTADLLNIVDTLSAKGVHLVSRKEAVDSSTPTGKLMLTMIGAIAEFERANLLERQREGIAIAKREGKYKGRTPVTPADFAAQYARYQRREIPSKAELARVLKISRPTLDKLIKEQVEG